MYFYRKIYQFPNSLPQRNAYYVHICMTIISYCFKTFLIVFDYIKPNTCEKYTGIESLIIWSLIKRRRGLVSQTKSKTGATQTRPALSRVTGYSPTIFHLTLYSTISLESPLYSLKVPESALSILTLT